VGKGIDKSHAVAPVASSSSADVIGSLGTPTGYVESMSGMTLYSPQALCKLVGVTTATLNKYGKQAGVRTPIRGGRNHEYSLKDAIVIFELMSKKSDRQTAANATKALLDLHGKSK